MAIFNIFETWLTGFIQVAVDTLKEFQFSTTIGTAQVVHQPVGVVGMITPWNSSTTQIASKIAHAVASGCTCVVKPSEISGLQTQILLECIHEAGLPAGAINVVNGLGEVVGTELTRNPDVAMIPFTGSTNIGKIIYRESIATMKRIVLELGGKSPNIVLEDADLNKAIPGAVMRCFMNNGQACIAGTRLIVPEGRLDEVKSLIKQTIANIKVGDPSEKDTLIGPMATEKHYNNVQRYIRLGLEEGAELVAGGEGHPDGLESGYYVKPTVFAHVNQNMTIAQEEIFGPVLSVITYRTEQEAIKIANDTKFGLGGYISSTNPVKAREVAAQFDAGVILINDSTFEMNAPFGGFKQSGIGREYGPLGMDEYMELKTIVG
ncbi:aldehyde dehydrogenase family protein [Paenibacillus physcomitrellae]|uniref:aldehyde dehydrogenase (NAD(+)) n=1 Tax=Paenibacillus physcomitrellae TaxID=1619311 RepID=A0ABQ1GXW0_9BACL|nr:aldehyde dehydrogenase family protein [Paenibacillus physcomitrellae]GGA52021.1 aldehyde dehydrogenase [Paenibacillus physcomitrellae]